MTLLLKRIYEAHSPEDGFRILVDRLWPRGVAKEAAAVDLWLKDAAPSPDLRTYFHGDPEGRWDEFRAHYLEELETNTAVETIVERLRQGTVTLVYAAKAPEHNHAAVLRDFLKRKSPDA